MWRVMSEWEPKGGPAWSDRFARLSPSFWALLSEIPDETIRECIAAFGTDEGGDNPLAR